eukprot:c6795_g1_i1.p1 GENE.c6795_g1_i1~~c6795_g1_i1.p1  ORF type:complete len:218 (+),score=38.45 c6795_g1_i1:2-655(+)
MGKSRDRMMRSAVFCVCLLLSCHGSKGDSVLDSSETAPASDQEIEFRPDNTDHHRFFQTLQGFVLGAWGLMLARILAAPEVFQPKASIAYETTQIYENQFKTSMKRFLGDATVPVSERFLVEGENVFSTPYNKMTVQEFSDALQKLKKSLGPKRSRNYNIWRAQFVFEMETRLYQLVQCAMRHVSTEKSEKDNESPAVAALAAIAQMKLEGVAEPKK